MKLKIHLLTIAVFSLSSAYSFCDDKELMKKITASYDKISKSISCKSITVFSLKKILDKNEAHILLDIRSPEEQKVSMLPNSITKEQFLKNPDEFKNKKIIAYCTIGYRSGKFAEKHKGRNVLNLEGGILAWSHIKGKFFKDNKETKQVHIHSKDWNFLHSDYKAVY